ncbi:MAG: hypothetical protein WKF56_02020 [Candidatus Limnocylindrales bacterium]
MPGLKMPDVRMPELHLPEMNRDDIGRALGEARRELGDLRRDLDSMRRDVEIPKVDLSRIDVPKAVTNAAISAGIVKKKTSRLPLAIGALVTAAVVGVALINSPALTSRVRAAIQALRERLNGGRGDDQSSDPYAFDAAMPMPVESSPYSDDLTGGASPFDGPTDLPSGLGFDSDRSSEGALGAPDGTGSSLETDGASRA